MEKILENEFKVEGRLEGGDDGQVFSKFCSEETILSPLTKKSDHHLIFSYIIIPNSHMWITRKREMITN